MAPAAVCCVRATLAAGGLADVVWVQSVTCHGARLYSGSWGGTELRILRVAALRPELGRQWHLDVLPAAGFLHPSVLERARHRPPRDRCDDARAGARGPDPVRL